MSPDNWTLINGLLSGWPALPSWSLADQMDSSAGIMNRILFIRKHIWKVFSIPSPAPCAEGTEKKDKSYLQGDCSLRPGSQVNGKQLEFSYPFGKCLLSMSSVLGSGDLAGKRKM